MRKYILNIFLFILPLFLPLLFILVIDPYNFINLSKIIDDETKVKVMNGSPNSFTRGNMLWKLLKFRREPCPNLIIGDSDGFHIREELISELTGEKYFNFSISGANIATQTEIFWFAAKRTEIKKVFLQLTFELCNQNKSYNLFNLAQVYINKPYLYFTDKEIFVDSFRNLTSKISNNSHLIDHSYLNGSKEEMMDYVRVSGESFLKNYVYPDKYLAELKKISAFCKDHNIQLGFIIFPSSNLANENIMKYNLVQIRDRFYEEIQSIGPTYNFLSSYRNVPDTVNFIDFAHTSQRVTDSMTVEIWKTNYDD